MTIQEILYKLWSVDVNNNNTFYGCISPRTDENYVLDETDEFPRDVLIGRSDRLSTWVRIVYTLLSLLETMRALFLHLELSINQMEIPSTILATSIFRQSNRTLFTVLNNMVFTYIYIDMTDQKILNNEKIIQMESCKSKDYIKRSEIAN